MKNLLSSFAVGCALVASPLSAQNDTEAPAMDAAMAAVQEAFAAEPLTAEEETRLPAATKAVGMIMPDGIYAKMMGDMFDGMLGAFAGELGSSMPAAELADSVGLSAIDVAGLSAEEREEATALLDPVYPQRTEKMMSSMTASLTDMMAAMEPAVRKGLSRAYAKRFTAEQLADINAFFATPTGAFYAPESMLVFTDPQAMSGAMEAMPAMMEAMPAMMAAMEQATADLPAERDYAALSEEERQRLADLLEISVEELEQGMESAAAGESDDWSLTGDESEYAEDAVGE